MAADPTPQDLCVTCGATISAAPIPCGPFQVAPPDKCQACLKLAWFATKHLVRCPWQGEHTWWRPKK